MFISDNHVHLIVSCWLLIVFVCRQRMMTTEYSKLWEVVSQLLLLSHGQASVERGFSINKQMERTNMCHETFIAERIVNDHLRSVGGVLSVAINKELLASSGRLREVCSGWRTEDHHLHIRLLTAPSGNTTTPAMSSTSTWSSTTACSTTPTQCWRSRLRHLEHILR